MEIKTDPCYWCTHPMLDTDTPVAIRDEKQWFVAHKECDDERRNQGVVRQAGCMSQSPSQVPDPWGAYEDSTKGIRWSYGYYCWRAKRDTVMARSMVSQMQSYVWDLTKTRKKLNRWQWAALLLGVLHIVRFWL